MPGRAPTASIIASESAFLDLGREWDGLFARARSPSISQSHAWSRCVWEKLLRPRGGRLRCVTLRDAEADRRGRLRLVWPTAVLPHHRLWSVLVPLGSGEYTDVLAEDAPDAAALAALAWATLRSRCRADFIFLERVRLDSLLGTALGATGQAPSHIRPAPCVTWGGAGWDAYWNGLSRNLRSQTDRHRRRLAARGALEFEVAGEGERYRTLAAWMLQHKTEWLARTANQSEWVGARDYADFVAALPDYAPGAAKMFALCQGDTVLAAELNCLSGHAVEFVNGAYDPAREKFSPGHILRAFSLRWAFDRGLAYDFRPGEERYKTVYANDGCDTANVYLTASRWGRVHNALGNVRQMLRARR